MKQVMQIGNQEIQVKEYNGQRVVTFKDIDLVHERNAGTAKWNFNHNKQRFVEGQDFIPITRKEFGVNFTPNEKITGNPNLMMLLITESGYLMLVKSFTDDLAWAVQRQLVNCYFQVKDEINLEINNNVLSHKERIKVMEILSNCSQYNLPYVLDLAKPFLSSGAFARTEQPVEIKMTVKGDFANILNRAMRENGLNQTQLAKTIPCGKSAISQYCNGINKPSTERLLRIAEVLNICIDEFYR